LAQPGKYERTVRLRLRYGFMSHYFDHLLIVLFDDYHTALPNVAYSGVLQTAY